MLGDDHSLIGGLMMHGLVDLLDYLDDHCHFGLSYVCAPWMWGLFVCFAPCFASPM